MHRGDCVDQHQIRSSLMLRSTDALRPVFDRADLTDSIEMRFPRFRITIRWMMIGVAILGVFAWLTITAVSVVRDPNAESMSHLRQRRDTGELIVYSHPTRGTFWPRYWRRLLGRPWPGNYVCPSCRADHEGRDEHALIDLDCSADGTEMLIKMSRLNEDREERRINAILERERRERSDQRRDPVK